MLSPDTSAPSVPLDDLIDLIEAALRAIARRIPRHISRDDIASAGRLALVKAASTITGTREEVRAYCFVRVRGAMLDELRAMDPLSRQDRRLHKAAAEARERFEEQHGRIPSQDTLAGMLGLAPRMLARLEARLPPLTSDEIAIDTLPCPFPSPDSEVVTEEMRAAVRTVLAALPRAEAHAIRRYHLEDASLHDIALELGVSIERVRQVRTAGERRLKAALIAALE